jgi:hypothetical protein
MFGSTKPAAFRWALVALCTACTASGSSGPRMTFPHQPAVGRPSTCPDDAVDPGSMGPGVGPLDVRCSYDDTTAGPLVQLRGKVLLEGDAGAMPESLAEAVVTIHDARKANAPALGRATTDSQGAYSMSLSLPAGSYELRVSAPETTEVLATRRIEVPDGASNMSGVDLILQMDPRLRAPGPEPAP